LIVIDDFLSNPVRTRRNALKADYIDWLAPDGEIYKRICITEIDGFKEGIEKHFGEVEMLGMGFRLNHSGEMPNAAIHSDLGWGTHAAVLYLSDGIGGTAFWKHKATCAVDIYKHEHDLLEQVSPDWDDESKWEMQELANIKFNRCILYESAKFHSRWPFEAFGKDANSGRLIAVAFFNVKGFCDKRS